MPFFTSNKASLYYETHGDGPALIFTHGASWDHRQWQPQVDFVKKGCRVVVWDVRGHGQSSLPPGRVDPHDFYQDLVNLLNHLGIDRAVLAGLSLGGHISLQAAAHYPDRAAALVLIGTPFTNTFNLYERIAVPINRFSQRLMPMPLIAWSVGAYLGGKQPEVRRYAFAAIRQIRHNRWVRLWDAVTRMESAHLLDKVLCPTLLLEGEHDSLVHRQQRVLAGAIQASQHRIVPGAGHATNLENPAAVNDMMAEFIDKVFKHD